MASQTPIIIKTSTPNWQSEINQLTQNHPELQTVDHYQNQIAELFKIRFPKKAGNSQAESAFIQQFTQGKGLGQHGNWIYYPWSNTLVHLLAETEFQEVRTARNRPIITSKQQQQLMDLTLGIVGLSVGNAIAQNITYSGGANTIKLADADFLDLSNLNRVQAKTADLGSNKAQITARQIYDINPYARISIHPEKITAQNLKGFLTAPPKLDILIDECDDLTLKGYLRLAARALKIPFLSITDVGLESQVDFHRFDLSSNTANMHELPDFTLDDLLEAYKMSEPVNLSIKEQLKLIVDIVGVENVSVEMQRGSMDRAELKIAGWPQLAMTVFAGGSLATFSLLQYTSGYRTYARQKKFSFNQLLRPGFNSPQQILLRNRHLLKFKRFLRSIT